MTKEKKNTKSYFNQVLYLTVAHKDKDIPKPYTVKQVIEMFKTNEIKLFTDTTKLDKSTDGGIQSLLNGMLSLDRNSKYNLYLYEKKENKFHKLANQSLKRSDFDSEKLYLSEQANL